MAMYYKLFCALAIISTAFIACQASSKTEVKKSDEGELEEPGSMNAKFVNGYNNDSLRKSLLDKALNKGDTNSYDLVSGYYHYGGGRGEREFLFHALSMADKYDYPPAYFHAYVDLSHLKNDKALKLLADYYLIKAFKKGDRSADIAVKGWYGDSFDSARLERYFERIEKALYKNDIKY